MSSDDTYGRAAAIMFIFIRQKGQVAHSFLIGQTGKPGKPDWPMSLAEGSRQACLLEPEGLLDMDDVML